MDPCFRSPKLSDSDVTSESLEASDSASAGRISTANGTKEMSDYHDDDFDDGDDDDHDVANDGDDGDIHDDADAGHNHYETSADGVTDTRGDWDTAASFLKRRQWEKCGDRR